MNNYSVKSRAAGYEANVKLISDELYAVGGDFEKSKKIVASNVDALPDTSKFIKDINIVIGDGDVVIASGTLGYSAPISFSGKITSWNLAEVSSPPISGSIVIDIWKSTAENYPPTEINSITANSKPELNTQYINKDEELVDWNTYLSSGDVIGFTVEQNLNCRKVHLILSVEVGF